ncbi:tetraspanin-8-like [Halichoeres trimaculatus]|uniref:tetraspanin-8-like n=1 Tax=Halichoeres trimaculatus TaxID=147232 RepID=UPI003D9E99F3
MGKINGCIKCLFIFFNVLYAIFGCILIIGAVKASAIYLQVQAVGAPNLGWIWVFAISVLVISCLGIYAGISEKAIILKIFAGFMVVGMIIMLILGIVVVVLRDKVKQKLDAATTEFVSSYMKEESVQNVLRELQTTAKCCGVVSASDWGDEIPQSCDCKSSYGGYDPFGSPGCKARPQGTTGPDQIYKQSCADYIFSILNFVFQISMGFFFGLAVTALLGLLISLLMIHQVKRHDSAAGSSMAMKGY